MGEASTQVLVVGGGPAGATTAALLAREGIAVTLLERETFPRYHIGESLLPSCLRIFDILGVRNKVEAHGFIRKDGGYFDWGGDLWEIPFGSLSRPLYGFQVVRSEFDKLLLDHARSQGVEVREGADVKELIYEDGRPATAHFTDCGGAHESISFQTLVDASGRAGLISNRYLRNRRFHQAFMNVGLWTYWRNAKRLAVGPSGAIATCSVPLGWVWAIPLHDDSLSVGLVLHRSKLKELKRYFTLDEIYGDAIASSRVVGQLVEGADRPSPLRTETDYSYAAESFSGQGYYLVGDAACFLDPLLSTGVHLATFSGMVAAASITSSLRGEVGEGEAALFFRSTYRRAYLRMLVVVSTFYQSHRERDTHFRKAQQLTNHDYSDTELMQAFLHIVSGVEDLNDIAEVHPDNLLRVLSSLYEEHYDFVRRKPDWERMPLSEINKGIARTRVVGAVQEEFSLTPETAVNGLYVGTEPNLGLRCAGN